MSKKTTIQELALPSGYQISEGQERNPKFGQKGHEDLPAIPADEKATNEKNGDGKTPPPNNASGSQTPMSNEGVKNAH